MSYTLYENIKLSIPDNFLLEYDGKFVLRGMRRIRKRERVINGIIVPISIDYRKQLQVTLAALIRRGIAVLDSKFIVTPSNRIVKNGQKIMRQLQTGGYDVKKNIASKKRRRSLDIEPANKRQRIDDFNFIVNVKYSISYVTQFTGMERAHTHRGSLETSTYLILTRSFRQLARHIVLVRHIQHV